MNKLAFYSTVYEYLWMTPKRETHVNRSVQNVCEKSRIQSFESDSVLRPTYILYRA